MKYLNNAWYVAAWSQDLTSGQLLARTMLDQKLVLFRDAQGNAAALADRCSHRFAPLSMGKMVDGSLQCGYHGMRYAADGRCVLNPQQPDHISPRSSVRSYPVLERDTLLWVWMGDPDKADPALAPSFPVLNPESGWRTVRGMIKSPANYLLVIDNLMDLSHPEFLHDSSLGSPALKTAEYEVIEESPWVLHSNRWFKEGPIAPLMEVSFPTNGRMVEHWANMRWERASNLWLDVGVTFTGDPRSKGQTNYSAHLLSPETTASTHYFFSFTRNFDNAAPEEERLATDGFLVNAIRNVFVNEDGPMVAAVQEAMGDVDLLDLKPSSMPGDLGALRVRLALAKLIEAETA